LKIGGNAKRIRLVFALIFSIAKSLVAACIFLILAYSAASQGFLEWHLKIVLLSEVEPADEMPQQSMTGGNLC
jgi:hypothetical protein